MSWTASLKSLFADVVIPLRALAVALAGVVLAWAWFSSYGWWAVIGAAAFVLAGFVLERQGYSRLPLDPMGAVRLMEFWVISPAAVSAVAAMIVVILTVMLTTPTEAPTETQKMMASVSAALTGFFTSSFIDWSGDTKDSRTASRIREHFFSRYKRADDKHPPGFDSSTGNYYFPAGSKGERWVYSNEFSAIEGWGYEARRKRAGGIAAAIAEAKQQHA